MQATHTLATSIAPTQPAKHALSYIYRRSQPELVLLQTRLLGITNIYVYTYLATSIAATLYGSIK